MNYITIGKNKLGNLKHSLKAEILRSNRAGSYASTTVICSNTRKYHGLLVCPVPELDNEQHVLLSDIDETIIQRGAEFHLGLHKYPGNTWNPKGHKYTMRFDLDPIPTLTYRVGGVKLQKQLMLIEREERILIKYTLLDAHSPTRIRLQPFLAFRNKHQLSKENLYANMKGEKITRGVKYKLYDGYPYLNMQVSKANEFIVAPDWYRNIEYVEEEQRGYDFREDLFVPGFFEFTIKKGESVYFSAGTKPTIAGRLEQQFESENTSRTPRTSFENNLKNAAAQFFVRKKRKTEIIAGFPWFGRWGRDTFISLPGLTLSLNDPKSCEEVLNTISGELVDGLFPNIGSGKDAVLNSVDAPLWYIWAIQQYAQHTGNFSLIKKKYWPVLKEIIEKYKRGTHFNIHMESNGLIWQGEAGKALTWMDAVVSSGPVTPRIGFAVEINALWYNAINFALELAKQFKDNKFINEWNGQEEKIADSFIQTFWNENKTQIADYVDDTAHYSVRPNQIFAVSLPYSPLPRKIQNEIVNQVRKDLLTPKGLRTLSPRHPDYIGVYEGNQEQRDKAYHQGTVWPWLLGHYAEAYFKLHEKSGLNHIKKLYASFEEEMGKHGLGSISEVYDGDPPHEPGGAISQAWSVAELLRIHQMISKFEKGEKK